jgi:hypothetical protein
MSTRRTDKVILTFVGGEVTPLLDGRTDVERVVNGCRTLQNMTVDSAGAAVRRKGLRYVASIRGFEPPTGWYLVGQTFTVNGAEAADNMLEPWTLINE